MEKKLPNYYRVLKVKKTATPEEIKTAYKKLAMQHHPDRNPGDAKAEERFKAVGEAFEVLSDERKRKEYDETGKVSGGIGRDPDSDLHQSVMQILRNILTDLALANTLKRREVIKLFQARVEEAGIRPLEKQLKELKILAEQFEDAATRFDTTEPVNVLKEMMESSVKTLRISMEQCSDELAKQKRLHAFFGKYTYRTDATPTNSDFRKIFNSLPPYHFTLETE